MGKKNLSEAEEAFKQATEKDPTNDNAYQGLGWAQLNQGKKLNAKDSFEKCIKLNPKNSAALNGEGTRTLNLRIDRPSQTHVNPCKQRTPENDLTLTCQVPPDMVITDTDLIRLIEKCPQLSDEFKAGIMRIIG